MKVPEYWLYWYLPMHKTKKSAFISPVCVTYYMCDNCIRLTALDGMCATNCIYCKL